MWPSQHLLVLPHLVSPHLFWIATGNDEWLVHGLRNQFPWMNFLESVLNLGGCICVLRIQLQNVSSSFLGQWRALPVPHRPSLSNPSWNVIHSRVSSCLHAHLVTRKGFIQRFGKKRKIGMQFWVTGMYNPDYGISFWTMIVGYKCIPPITWDEIGGYDLMITNYPGIYIYRDYLHSISMIFPWII